MDSIEEIDQNATKPVRLPANLLNAYIFNQTIDNLFIVLYGILMILALLISISIVIIILKKSSMRTSRNTMLINNCILNIIYCLVLGVGVLRMLIRKYDLYWTKADCKFHHVLLIFSSVGFPLSLTGILLDNILEIHCRSKLTSYSVHPLIVIPVVWFVSFVLACPEFYFTTNIILIFQFETGDTITRSVCYHDFPEAREWHVLVIDFFAFVIPISFVLYLIIKITLKYKNEDTILYQDSRLLYVLITHLIVLMGLSLPFYVVDVLLAFKINLSLSHFALVFLYFWSSLPSMFIPLLYSVISDNVCQETKIIFQNICGRDICPCIKVNNNLSPLSVRYNRDEDDQELESIHNPVYIDYHQPSQESEDFLGMLRRLS